MKAQPHYHEDDLRWLGALVTVITAALFGIALVMLARVFI
jgi:hypothetical protein